MTKQAKVVNENGVLMAEITRTEACAHCGACELGKKERVLYPLPSGDFQEGDTVEIRVAEHTVTKATLWAYGLPLIGLALGLLIGSLFSLNEPLQFCCALTGAASGLLIIRLTEKRRKARGRYDCTIQRPD